MGRCGSGVADAFSQARKRCREVRTCLTPRKQIYGLLPGSGPVATSGNPGAPPDRRQRHVRPALGVTKKIMTSPDVLANISTAGAEPVAQG
ncbi:hypothetical protein FMEAI12_3340022 [Parafrankia sp. Ea1.12]|nr:hypothetical protein FMEAI12_3340022 [Parafrankia sp. Ea1.12]